jgi:hypothetical protein
MMDADEEIREQGSTMPRHGRMWTPLVGAFRQAAFSRRIRRAARRFLRLII